MRAAVRWLWWCSEGQGIELVLPLDGGLLHGTSCKGDFFLQLLDPVGRCWRW